MKWFERKDVGQSACQSWLLAYCCNGYLKIKKSSSEHDPIDSLITNALKLLLTALLIAVPFISFAKPSTEDIYALVSQGFEAFDAGNFDLAERLAQEAQAILEKGPVEDTSEGVSKDSAKDLWEKMMALHHTIPNRKNWPELWVLRLMATVHQQQSKFQQAEPYFRKILELDKNQHTDMGMWACTGLANLLELTNRLPEAVDTLTNCLPTGYVGGFSQDDKTVAFAYIEILRAVGRVAEAEKYGRAMLLELKQQEIPDHRAMAKLTNNLARVVSSKKNIRWSEAESLLKESLTHYKEVTTEDDLDYLDALYDFGNALAYQNELDEAETILDKVVKARVRLTGKDHMNTATASAKLGLLLFIKGRYTDAEPLLEDAFNAFKKIYGRDALSTRGLRGRPAYELLVETLKKLDKNAKAEKLQFDNQFWTFRPGGF